MLNSFFRLGVQFKRVFRVKGLAPHGYVWKLETLNPTPCGSVSSGLLSDVKQSFELRFFSAQPSLPLLYLPKLQRQSRRRQLTATLMPCKSSEENHCSRLAWSQPLKLPKQSEKARGGSLRAPSLLLVPRCVITATCTAKRFCPLTGCSAVASKAA